MAIEIKQTVKLSQQLLITPQLQQAIKLLQLSRVELVETVQKELLENPVLEENDDREPVEGMASTHLSPADRQAAEGTSQESAREPNQNDSKEFDWMNYIESTQFSQQREPRSFSDTSTEDLPNYENIVTATATLQDHLEWQIKMGSYLDHEKDVCLTIIGAIDETGYLSTPLEELAEKTTFTIDELEDGLFIIQELDPPGVGARSLQECLKIQSKQIESERDRKLIVMLIDDHLPLLERRNYAQLAKKLNVSVQKAKDLTDIILSFEPKPGRAYASNDTQYVTPDIYVKKVGSDFTVIMNEDGLPRLQISNLYRKAILSEAANKNGQNVNTSALAVEAKNYIQDKLKSALWLIKSIHQRQKTLYKVTKSIVQFQREFFEKGVQYLKPLVLRDVADEIGVHESTVSRATNGKFVHTPQGIFELKYFFNTGISSSTGGQDVANEAVKQMIKTLIGSENQNDPLSDQSLAEILKKQNINVARRTVAKYRELLGILPSSRRRRFE